MGQQRPLVAAASERSPIAPMFSAVLSLPGLSLDLHSPHPQLSTFFFLSRMVQGLYSGASPQKTIFKGRDRQLSDGVSHPRDSFSSDQGFLGNSFYLAACITFPPFSSIPGQLPCT